MHIQPIVKRLLLAKYHHPEANDSIMCFMTCMLGVVQMPYATGYLDRRVITTEYHVFVM